MRRMDVARAMWTLYEPVHDVTYFAPEAQAAYQAAGLRGYWRGYFAGRAAPLGAVGPEPVVAAFYGFAPGMVARALPSVWALASPEDALRARTEGAVAALARLLDGVPGVAEAADLLERAADAADLPGRVLAAAHQAALPRPADDLGRLWRAASVLREHRGDGHVAALVANGVGGIESLVLRAGLDLPRAYLQPFRGWTDDEWSAAADRLAGRGWLDGDGRITDAGCEVHDAVEAATDRAAAAPWQALGAAATDRLRDLLEPVATACHGVIPAESPVGLPKR
jgi:hypothetical protein